MIIYICLINVNCNRRFFSTRFCFSAKTDNDYTFSLSLDYTFDGCKVQGFEHAHPATSTVHSAQLAPKTAHTVEQLLAIAGTEDCIEAEALLRQEEELVLEQFSF